MAVYVDDVLIPATVGPMTSRWSHLMADTREELVAFAVGLGMRPEWIQDKASGVHFDVTEPTRARAIELGAVPIRAGSDQWRRVADEARQQFSGERRPRRYPVD